MVKRILKKYGYPPDKQAKATETVLEQAELIAAYLTATPAAQAEFRRTVREDAWPDLTGGYRYLGLARMSYYVNKDAYRAAVRRAVDGLRGRAPKAAARRRGILSPARKAQR